MAKSKPICAIGVPQLNQSFGRWRVIDAKPFRRLGRWHVNCRCECGKEFPVDVYRLMAGISTGCGCRRHRTPWNKGMRTRKPIASEYRIWKGMRQRCNNPRDAAFANYGGRGITVCRRWDKYANFIADMGTRPSPEHSLDRINNGRGYSPVNCRWVERDTQANNTRRNRFVAVGGERKTVSQWCKSNGLSMKMVHARLAKGWDTEKAITTPKSVRIVDIGGTRRTITEWYHIHGVHPKTVSQRVRNGWSIQKAITTPIHSSRRRRDTPGLSNAYLSEYSIWRAMRDRCNNPLDRSHPNYGGRGIKVCRRWNSFANFIADMGPRPSDQHSLDRKNVNGNYTPLNCRWATRKEQSRNKRNSRRIAIDGVTKCAADWCDHFGVPLATAMNRLHMGWSPLRAVSEPVRGQALVVISSVNRPQSTSRRQKSPC